MRLSILLYDIEIQRAILARGDSKLPGIHYCKGWSDYPGMGIAVVCAYDYLDQSYRVFDESQLESFGELIDQREVIAGFNSVGFDNKVCAAQGIVIPPAKNYDILLKIKAGTSDKSHGLSLGNCCHANFGTDKSGNGADAPLLYQRGQWEELVKYCLQDVRLTKMLLDRILEQGEIIDPRSTERNTIIHVEKPRLSGLARGLKVVIPAKSAPAGSFEKPARTTEADVLGPPEQLPITAALQR